MDTKSIDKVATTEDINAMETIPMPFEPMAEHLSRQSISFCSSAEKPKTRIEVKSSMPLSKYIPILNNPERLDKKPKRKKSTQRGAYSEQKMFSPTAAKVSSRVSSRTSVIEKA